ncbi:hypothetical protein [Paracoccus laeviglucosivorans]|uniref:Lipoprotein n=1 Tax=Paracoccus laeviglucosivorans TaxID=1197861 RepID=A0A521FSJ4_9RHOB|nr:hypothetical protein [Paracoccus laeviglucosivorans]SMO99205.1 hypothetical protein SAMN06265221_14111 [Paracoccus laeviglucosivorans]
MSKAIFLGTILLLMAGCASDAASRKTNCWTTMTLAEMPAGECVFHDVAAR